jgi:osmotically-inducible protein OsmY
MTEDQKLRQRVLDELEFEPTIDASQIGIAARDGVVILSGHVSSYVEKYIAERAAGRVKGVRAIAQEIEVHLPSGKKTADEEIAARAVRLLDWDVAVPHQAISVKVEHGIVTLTGHVDKAFQRDHAEEDMHKLSGVKAVINEIRVHQPAAAVDLQAKIKRALERRADLEAGDIVIDAAEGKVRLSGTVRSWGERKEVERAVWSTPGVVAVDNQIAVDWT